VRRLLVNDLTLFGVAVPVSFLVGMAVRLGRFEAIHPYLYQKREMPHIAPSEVKMVRRAVSRAVRLAPSKTCLTQASLGKILMNLIGGEATLHVGVRVAESSEVRAHAWLSVQGITIVGGPESKVAPFRQIAQFR
jgi:hypothetical protein